MSDQTMNDQQFDNTNRGVLFVNNQQGNDLRPHFRGTLNVGGVEFNISCWKRVSKKNTPFLSLSIEKKPEIEQAPPVLKPNAPTFDDLADMPF